VKVDIDKNGFVLTNPKIKTADEVDAAKAQEVRELMAQSLDPSLAEEQWAELYLKIKTHDGLSLLPDWEQSSYRKKLDEKYEQLMKQLDEGM
jgi:hypothetical protein